MALMLTTPFEMSQQIAKAARQMRLRENMSQSTLSDRSGVSLSVIKKFERTGIISLGSLLKIAAALGALGDFDALFKPTPLENLPTLDEILAQRTRQRGRE